MLEQEIDMFHGILLRITVHDALDIRHDVGIFELEFHSALVDFSDVEKLIHPVQDTLAVAKHGLVILLPRLVLVAAHKTLERTYYQGERVLEFVGDVCEELELGFIYLLGVLVLAYLLLGLEMLAFPKVSKHCKHQSQKDVDEFCRRTRPRRRMHDYAEIARFGGHTVIDEAKTEPVLSGIQSAERQTPAPLGQKYPVSSVKAVFELKTGRCTVFLCPEVNGKSIVLPGQLCLVCQIHRLFQDGVLPGFHSSLDKPVSYVEA